MGVAIGSWMVLSCADGGGLGIGARYGVSTRILGALISFWRNFLTTFNASVVGDGGGIA